MAGHLYPRPAPASVPCFRAPGRTARIWCGFTTRAAAGSRPVPSHPGRTVRSGAMGLLHAVVGGADEDHGQAGRDRRRGCARRGGCRSGPRVSPGLRWTSTPSSSSSHTSPSSTTSKSIVAVVCMPGRVRLHVPEQAGHVRARTRRARPRRRRPAACTALSGGTAKKAEAEAADGREVRLVRRHGPVVGEVRRPVAAPQEVELRPRRQRRAVPVDLGVAGDDGLAVGVVTGDHRGVPAWPPTVGGPVLRRFRGHPWP